MVGNAKPKAHPHRICNKSKPHCIPSLASIGRVFCIAFLLLSDLLFQIAVLPRAGSSALEDFTCLNIHSFEYSMLNPYSTFELREEVAPGVWFCFLPYKDC
jgi:hypothetical protein